MTCFILKTTLVLLLLFAAALGVIRAQPYSDGELSAFLDAVQRCSPTCFMDVQLGVTKADEALEIFKTHAWVKEAYISTNRLGETYIVVEWSGQQPALMKTTLLATFFFDPSSRVVEGFRVITHATLGDMWLSLGTPQAGELLGKRAHYAIYAIENEDRTYLMLAYSIVNCPVDVKALWQSSLMVSVSRVDGASVTQPYKRSSWRSCLFSGR